MMMAAQGFTTQGQGPEGVLANGISNKTRVLRGSTGQFLWCKYSNTP